MKQYLVEKVTLPNGETIAYRRSEKNQDEIVLLIHGNMSSSVHWQTTMEALENQYQVIAPDMRGFGDSTYNENFDHLHELAEDIEQFMIALEIKQCTVIGWSTGGGVALELAINNPDLITKIILLESVALTGYPMFLKDELMQPTKQRITTKEEIANDPIQVLPVLNAYKNQDKKIMRMIWDGIIYNNNQPEENDYELYLEAMLKQKNLVDIDYALSYFNITNKNNGIVDGNNRMKKIKAPVIILQGENDLVVPPSWGQGTKDYLQDKAELIMMENMGHSPMTDNPKEFFAILKDAISK